MTNNNTTSTNTNPGIPTTINKLDDASIVTETTRDMSYCSVEDGSSMDDFSQATLSTCASSNDLMAPEAGAGAGASVDQSAYLRDELYGRVQKEPELFEWIQRAALDGMWYWDLENGENEWLSPEFKHLFGYTDEEVPNTSSWWQENIFPQDKEKAINLFYRHVNEGVPYDSIVRYRHKNGSTVWVRCRGQASFNEEGVPVRMLGAHSDVTRLMEVQEQLKEKEAVLDMLCTTALDGFWDWNMKTGEDFLSSRWKKALGYEEEDIENTVEGWRALLHPDDITKADEAARRHMDLGENYSVVLRYKRKDGSYAHMLAQGVAQKDEQGEWVRMFGTHTDVSYLEEARAARQASEAKTTFLATMSHEIRTPLNAVLGMATALQATNLTAEQQDCVDTLTNSGKHLLALINDILDFSQIEAGLVAISNQKFSVQETVREVVNAMQLGAKAKGIAMTFDTSIPPGAQFISDPERTRQICFNLAGNAVKFTQKGSVNVSLAMEERGDDDDNNNNRMWGVRITVKDTGCGMAQEHLPKIFEDFTQASSEVRHRYGGSGLGLSISKKLVVTMGGTIGVESELGVGSTFTVWLPGFIPETTTPRTTKVKEGRDTTQVLLYEERWNACAESANDDEDHGSVAKAIRATGRSVVRVPDLTQLEEAFQQQQQQKQTKKPPFSQRPVVVCALKEGGHASDHTVAQRLSNLNPAILLDVGRRIDTNLLQQHQLASKVPISVCSVQTFPTTDELEEAFHHQPTQNGTNSNHDTKGNKDKSGTTRLSNGFALGKMGRDMRILLAEDNAINVKVMRKLLSRFPCKVEVACNGAVAVEKAKSGTWDLILMDMIMPEMDGVDATKEIRQFDKSTYIVALTANATTEDRDNCLQAGMNEFLSKPVNLPALGHVLAHISTVVARNESGDAANTVGAGAGAGAGADVGAGADAKDDNQVPETLEAVARLLYTPTAA